MTKYDDASWHYEGNYPENLPAENAATHIGVFLAWCINNDLLSEEQLEDNSEDIKLVKSRKMTGAEYLINNCDGKLLDEDLNKVGNKFVKAYYEYAKPTKFAKSYANYLADYSKTLSNDVENDVYTVENTWENYDLLRPLIDQRFEEWQAFSVKK